MYSVENNRCHDVQVPFGVFSLVEMNMFEFSVKQWGLCICPILKQSSITSKNQPLSKISSSISSKRVLLNSTRVFLSSTRRACTNCSWYDLQANNFLNIRQTVVWGIVSSLLVSRVDFCGLSSKLAEFFVHFHQKCKVILFSYHSTSIPFLQTGETNDDCSSPKAVLIPKRWRKTHGTVITGTVLLNCRTQNSLVEQTLSRNRLRLWTGSKRDFLKL